MTSKAGVDNAGRGRPRLGADARKAAERQDQIDADRFFAEFRIAIDEPRFPWIPANKMAWE